MSFSNSGQLTIQDNATLNNIQGDQFNQTSLAHGHGYHVGSSTRNNVQGNQVNQTFSAEVIHYHEGVMQVASTVYDEFDHINRGGVYGVKHYEEICNYDSKWEVGGSGRYRVRKTIIGVELPKLPTRHSKFTIIEYEGDDAQTYWERDFRSVAHTSRKPSLVQLFAINRSKVPMLIFYDELIPLRNLSDDRGFPSILMELYIQYLSKQLGDKWRLWMNPSTGIFCIGPRVSPIGVNHWTSGPLIEVPSDLEMLKDDISARFFTSKPQFSSSESKILAMARNRSRHSRIEGFFAHPGVTAKRRGWYSDYEGWPWQKRLCHLPDEVGALRLDTVYSRSVGAVAAWPEEDRQFLCSWRDWSGNLIEKTMMPGSMLTRFKFHLTRTFDRHQWLSVEDSTAKLAEAWFAQFPWICSTLDGPSEEESFIIFWTHMELHGEVESWCPELREETLPNIYLFVRPPPMTIAELRSWRNVNPTFWSFDQTGHTQMSDDERRRLGLPVFTPSKEPAVFVRSWPAHVYKSLLQWQSARGFDPVTSDWAREMGYPELKIVGQRKGLVDQLQGVTDPTRTAITWYAKGFHKRIRRLWTPK